MASVEELQKEVQRQRQVIEALTARLEQLEAELRKANRNNERILPTLHWDQK